MADPIPPPPLPSTLPAPRRQNDGGLARRLAEVLSGCVLDPIVLEALGRFIRAADGVMPRNTERAWLSDLGVFAQWCRQAGETVLPAQADAVAAFVDWAGPARRPTTVQRYITSIAKLHAAVRLLPPTEDPVVRMRLKALRRDKKARPRQAAPLRETHVADIVGGLGNTLIELRDRALLLAARDTGLRGANLVGLQIEELAVDGAGVMTGLVDREKTDQLGHGRMVAFSNETRLAIEAWLHAADLGDAGPVFRAVTKGGRIGNRSLQPRTVLRRFRLMAREIGLYEGISAHSTRVGGAQDLLEEGYELPQIMQAFGWRDPRMAMRYGERILAARSVAVTRFDRRRRKPD